MKEKGRKKDQNSKSAGNRGKNNLQEYPIYPASEDIYSKYKEEKEINPEDSSKMKDSIHFDEEAKSNESDFNDDVSGSDLDVPGSELDDEQELIGNEDEENNYYSLGGDDHNDLDEDNDDLWK
jgi:hypothetical protein